MRSVSFRLPVLSIVFVIAVLFTGCGRQKAKNHTPDISKKTATHKSSVPSDDQPDSLIVPEGRTLKTRILPPKGYHRVPAKKGSLSAFLRGYKLKKADSPLLLYDRSPKPNQTSHAAIFRLPIENHDLQQCADSVMRVYAEYYWHRKEYDRIKFHFTNGFLAEYSKWRQGYRIHVNGNRVAWVRSQGPDTSYSAFQKYLLTVFTYAGTASMDTEAKPIDAGKIRVGDVFLKGGSPGHVVMVVDLCKNEKGQKAFLLAQGYMPAQEFHILKNPAHVDDPWYYVDEISYPFATACYTFEEGCLKRLSY